MVVVTRTSKLLKETVTEASEDGIYFKIPRNIALSKYNKTYKQFRGIFDSVGAAVDFFNHFVGALLGDKSDAPFISLKSIAVNFQDALRAMPRDEFFMKFIGDIRQKQLNAIPVELKNQMFSALQELIDDLLRIGASIEFNHLKGTRELKKVCTEEFWKSTEGQILQVCVSNMARNADGLLSVHETLKNVRLFVKSDPAAIIVFLVGLKNMVIQ